MGIDAEQPSPPPVLLGSVVQTGLRAFSIAVIAILVVRSLPLNKSSHQAPSVPADRLIVDINSADARELMLMPGIGKVTADRIVEDRRRNGPFDSTDDLQRVAGIGPKTVSAIAPFCSALPLRK